MAYNPNNVNGQATMANSEPVVIASNQSAFPVTVGNAVTAPVPIGLRHTSQGYRCFVPKQAVGANKVYFDIFNATGSGKTLRLRHCVPVVSGAVAVTGVVGVDLHLTRTTAVGTGGTTATSEGTALTAMTFCEMDATNTAIPAQITGRLTPGGGATAGAVLGWGCFFTEETNAATYLGYLNDLVCGQRGDLQAIIVPENTGIRVVQGSVASVGNIGFDIIFELE